jgi:hypothetical protein
MSFDSSLQRLYQIKEGADLPTQSHGVLEGVLTWGLANSVQARAESQASNHGVDLLRQGRHHGAEDNHLISAVQIDGSVRFDETSQAMDAERAILANPFGHEHVLSLLASAQRLPTRSASRWFE